MATAKTIAKALGGGKSGGGWTARCPAHDDRTPSLSIRAVFAEWSRAEMPVPANDTGKPTASPAEEACSS
jgi:hypothetical protein